jgi:hypothetical protein
MLRPVKPFARPPWDFFLPTQPNHRLLPNPTRWDPETRSAPFTDYFVQPTRLTSLRVVTLAPPAGSFELRSFHCHSCLASVSSAKSRHDLQREYGSVNTSRDSSGCTKPDSRTLRTAAILTEIFPPTSRQPATRKQEAGCGFFPFSCPLILRTQPPADSVSHSTVANQEAVSQQIAPPRSAKEAGAMRPLTGFLHHVLSTTTYWQPPLDLAVVMVVHFWMLMHSLFITLHLCAFAPLSCYARLSVE